MKILQGGTMICNQTEMNPRMVRHTVCMGHCHPSRGFPSGGGRKKRSANVTVFSWQRTSTYIIQEFKQNIHYLRQISHLLDRVIFDLEEKKVQPMSSNNIV